MSKRLCRTCKKKLPINIRGSLRVYCGRKCREAYYLKRSERLNLGHKICPTTTGAIGELIVAVDLAIKGWDVFRAISHSGCCDLIAIKNGKILRIEVTRGFVLLKGTVTPRKHNTKNYDVIAVWHKNKTVDYFDNNDHSTNMDES